MIRNSRFKKPLLIFNLVGALSSLGIQGLAADRSPDEWTWNNPKDVGVPGISHQTIKSQSMSRTVGFQIYLPPQYAAEPQRRFPTVYFLHGAGGTESSDAGLAWRVHAEITAGQIAPTIYVFPNGGQRSGYRDSATTYVRSETMLMRELLPYVHKKYRSINKPEARAICGFSMGGGGAIRLALKYPDIFGAAAGLAPAIFRSTDFEGGDNCFQHATALTTEKRERLRLYFVIGDEDFLFPRQAPFQEHLKKLGIRYTSVVHSDVSHNLGILSRLSADAMIRHLDRELAKP